MKKDKINIAIIGFMGTGKTEVGRMLARKMDRAFIEVDNVVEEEDGRSIPDIFEHSGEERFREVEMDVIKSVSKREGVVISCGGGVVLNQLNIDYLKKTSTIVLLTATKEEISRRVSTTDNRPLLNVIDRASKIEDLMEFREPLYLRSADIIIDTTLLSIEQVIDEIMKKVSLIV